MAEEQSLPVANGRMLNTAKRTRFRYPILSNNTITQRAMKRAEDGERLEKIKKCTDM